MNEISKYEFYFSNWLNNNMPDINNGYFISNIDYLLFNHFSKKFILLELKTRGNNITKGQKNMYNILHKRFQLTNGTDGYNYIGTYLITFNQNNFYDGQVYINGTKIKEKKRISENQLKEFLINILN